VTLLALNVAMFGFQLFGPIPAEELVASLGFIPVRFAPDSSLLHGDPSVLATVFTSMFLHGDVLHLAGNALYLWIFGNNVEDVLGTLRFLVLYAASGLGGHFLHFVTGPDSTVPTIGASGAISGLLAAYLVRFPRARVVSLVFLGFFVRTAVVPAWVVIVVWFVLQLLSGFVSLGEVAESGGIAWFEHVGGFAAGLVAFVLLGGLPRR
jgi:membrane associated rhomboid family serine protease